MPIIDRPFNSRVAGKYVRGDGKVAFDEMAIHREIMTNHGIKMFEEGGLIVIFQLQKK